MLWKDEIVVVHKLRCNLEPKTRPKMADVDESFFDPSNTDGSN